MSAKGFLGTILFGVAAGVAIGILMAPDKGDKTRRKMAARAHDFEGDLKGKIKTQTEKFDDLAEMLESGIDDFKCKVDKLSEKLQSKLG